MKRYTAMALESWLRSEKSRWRRRRGIRGADYTPQYLLDPESYTWNLLDDTLKSHLDTSKYFSLSAHSHSQPQSNPTPTTTPSSSSLPTSSPPSPSPLPSPAISSLPIFLRPTPIPGLLTLAELQSANLSAIKLQNRNQLFECSDLLNWEESDIADPSSIKGIIAELVNIPPSFKIYPSTQASKTCFEPRGRTLTQTPKYNTSPIPTLYCKAKITVYTAFVERYT
ncbi:hypothetical protein M7I_3802 [Glarea lozoyensis 74030]|uniref:Uncharacterized protein n=1 Tax=Glarea lozoyensis (strain ATCC 74030 / MF5533) TaxID=1104152 RepID=H0EMG6_GLAL7|nr:hypothetical protein M7I_3802 [Glarea lozoyensis 74030]